MGESPFAGNYNSTFHVHTLIFGATMDLSKPLWIGSTVDVRQGKDAEQALKDTSDAAFWSEEDGITKVTEERWEKAQQYERDCWMKHARTSKNDRNSEHKASFDGYSVLPSNLGNAVEIGCGPFTQLNTILSTGRTASNVTLVDPLLNDYLQHPNCTYLSGKLWGIPTRRLAMPAEQFEANSEFDLAVCINVLEHVRDANEILDNLHACLKPGGWLVFHDRSWDHIDITKIYDQGHPIRLKKTVLEAFLSRFEQRFRNGEYFIGVK